MSASAVSPADSRTRREGQPRAEIVVVANRLPVDRVSEPDGSVTWRRSPGGLVTALEPVMRRNDGAWIGWHGVAEEELEPFVDGGLSLVPVTLSTEEVAQYYEGFSNATLWPLYHDVVAPPEFHRDWWEAYVRVNQRFADRAAQVAEEDGVVWVQDYQLQLVPAMLRAQRPDLRIGFFLHIPFPPTELFGQLPWRREILRGLLGADLVGFQLPGGAANFVRLVRQRLGLKTHRDIVYLPDDRSVIARSYPISIDFSGLDELARAPQTRERAAQIRHDIGSPRHVLLGVDRLDYTKGIPQRLRAFAELLEDGAVSADEAVFIQVATPSRERVEQYRVLRDDIDRLVGRINGDVGRIGQQALTYLHTSYPREEMAALFTAADVMVVTPLRDGMNLVAKEYVACRVEQNGALVLSEFAGAAAELKNAYTVNPYDIRDLKDSMLRAIGADEKEQRRRMTPMRRQVADHDIEHWASSFLDELRQVRPPHRKKLKSI